VRWRFTFECDLKIPCLFMQYVFGLFLAKGRTLFPSQLREFSFRVAPLFPHMPGPGPGSAETVSSTLQVPFDHGGPMARLSDETAAGAGFDGQSFALLGAFVLATVIRMVSAAPGPRGKLDHFSEKDTNEPGRARLP
jgi:hypothetical protein